MQITVPLQDPFSYSLLPIVLLTVILAVSAVMIALFRPEKKTDAGKRRGEKAELPQTVRYENNLLGIKRRYLNQIAELEKKLSEANIVEREGYQELSLCVRHFVSEVTGIEVTRMTLSEIQRLQMPHIKELIAEFYAPEFAEGVQSDLKGAIDKTKRIIEEWK